MPLNEIVVSDCFHVSRAGAQIKNRQAVRIQIRILPFVRLTLAKAASSDELRTGFEEHLEQTKGHVQRLEEVFEELGEKTKGKTCQAMKGLIEEGSEVLKADGEDSVIDAAIIVAAQKVEHYEIAGYGSVRTFAQLLGQDKSAELLQQTLDEESEANELLNKLAEDIVNPEALMEPEMASASSDR